ncbi:3-deoxy-D-manno-octulosonic acid kinase [Alteromonas aestuariivivens]|uniref:3-deoxy-D-manno-octulosonic acid kinase n=1 Tax=Alteromonas aestuariivivens TaxID=1938339 RepID=A0A3D8M2V2_9ALTE|nr:3-deoxy-D-manno-octulosonic acid kinase [Alteromonas aestuariivivens]RDV23958.1 3-deoxy-D-manno-octulosonic acid kinase [Alteromonas aestuariivivens]
MATKLRNPAKGHFIVFDDQLVENPQPELFSAEFWKRRKAITGQAKGRGTTLFIRHSNSVWVLRHFCRGGLIGKLLSDQYLFLGTRRTRAFQEFQLLQHMNSLGLPVPRPIAAHIFRSGLIYRADLITALIPNSADLHHILCQKALTEQQWYQVGVTVARLHKAQVYHHDLNIRNIMLDAHQQVWIIDFDRCYVRAGVRWKQQTLDRLNRSLHKEQQRNPQFYWQEKDWQTLLNGYQATV